MADPDSNAGHVWSWGEALRPLKAPVNELPELSGYTLLEELGRGTSGRVFRARDLQAQREVAIKLLHVGSERARKRLEREAEVTARLTHPGIGTVHAATFSEGQAWIVYELIQGARPFSATGTWSQRLDVYEQLLDAVAYAHGQGVIHRDLKPDNVLIDRDERVRVVDFGLARSQDSERLTRSGALLGTPLYMAPELFRGGTASAQSDVWSLGVILYWLLSDELPFVSSSLIGLVAALQKAPVPLGQLCAGLPRAVVEVCERALSPLEQRYADAGAFAEALAQARSGARSRSRTGVVVSALAAVGVGACALALGLRPDGSTSSSLPPPVTESSVDPDPLSGFLEAGGRDCRAAVDAALAKRPDDAQLRLLRVEATWRAGYVGAALWRLEQVAPSDARLELAVLLRSLTAGSPVELSVPARRKAAAAWLRARAVRSRAWAERPALDATIAATLRERAQRDLKHSRALSPDGSAVFDRADGDPRAALAKLGPEDPDEPLGALLQRARAVDRAGERDRARELVLARCGPRPLDARAVKLLIDLGVSGLEGQRDALASRDPEGAEAAFRERWRRLREAGPALEAGMREVLALDPLHAEARWVFASARARQDPVGELRAALELCEAQPEVLGLRLHRLLRDVLRWRPEALDKLPPGWVRSVCHSIRLERSGEGDPAELEVGLSRLLARWPSMITPRLARAFVRIRLSRHDEAQHDLDVLAEVLPDSGHLAFYSGLLAAARGAPGEQVAERIARSTLVVARRGGEGRSHSLDLELYPELRPYARDPAVVPYLKPR